MYMISTFRCCLGWWCDESLLQLVSLSALIFIKIGLSTQNPYHGTTTAPPWRSLPIMQKGDLAGLEPQPQQSKTPTAFKAV
jgi:hypothetical protein